MVSNMRQVRLLVGWAVCGDEEHAFVATDRAFLGASDKSRERYSLAESSKARDTFT